MGEYQVNVYTSGAQTLPAVAIAEDGSHVIVWSSALQDSSGMGIYAQLFDSDGSRLGSEFLVNTFTSGSQTNPDVSMNADGSFVVTWDDSSLDGDSFGVFGQLYDASGTPKGSEFQINTFTNSEQSLSAVSMNRDGSFVVSWGSFGQDGNSYGVYAQRFDSSGDKLGPEFRVNNTTHGNQGVSTVSINETGDFLIAWQSSDDGDNFGIFAQMFSSAGLALGDEFRVNTYTPGAQTAPVAALAEDGSFVIAWQSFGQDGGSNGIYVQRFLADRTPSGVEIRVNSYTNGSQSSPSMSMAPDGRYVITWTSALQDGDGNGIYAQNFNSDGSFDGSEYLINLTTSGNQSMSDVALSSSGKLVTVWSSNDSNGSGENIYARTIDFAPVCFLKGTLILTDSGEKLVEMLHEGDRVVTLYNGLLPVRWIGTQRFESQVCNLSHQPICFHTGSLGKMGPHSPLMVSAGHSVRVNDVLVHASALINDINIVRERVTGSIAYYHIDLGIHDCVLANGVWAESYFEDRNRQDFHNYHEYMERFPSILPFRQTTCLPVVTAGDPRLPHLRALVRPTVRDDMLTHDHDIHFLADGHRIDVSTLHAGAWIATVPGNTRSLRLRSRAIRPDLLGASHDWRSLGVLVKRIEVVGGPTTLAHSAALNNGWHEVEYDNGVPFRWTNGDAIIPTVLLSAQPNCYDIIIRGWCNPKVLSESRSHTIVRSNSLSSGAISGLRRLGSM
jgi:hypothetical protein